MSCSYVPALVLDASSPATLYAGCGDGVYKSTNAGGSWARTSLGLVLGPLAGVSRLRIDPSQPAILYAGTSGNAGDGIFRSTDSGATWAAVNQGFPWPQDGLPSVSAIEVDPAGSAVYAGLSGGSVWKATAPSPAPARAEVSGGGTMCPGSTVQLSVSLFGALPWSLTWSDGVVQSGITSSPVLRSAGPDSTTAYTVTLVSDANGTGTSSGSALVTVLPTPTAVAGGTASICPGQSAALTGSGASSCVWSPSTGLSNAYSCAPSAAPASTTTYALQVFDGACTSTNTAEVTITLAPDTTGPAVTAPPGIVLDQTLCCGTLGGASSATSVALATFLVGGSATDACDPSPVRLAPQAGGNDVSGATCFESGTTPVTFRFRDLSSNTGSADSSVTVRMFGDLNLDAMVDPSDMVVLRAFFNFAISPQNPPFSAPLGSADLTHDGTVDPSDMVVLRAFFNFAVGCLAP